MIEQKKKLRLDELKVESFITSHNSTTQTLRGGNTFDGNGQCVKTLDAILGQCSRECNPGTAAVCHPSTDLPNLPNSNACYTGDACGNLPTVAGAVTCDANYGLPCANSQYTCNNGGTCGGAFCYGQGGA